MPNKNKKTKQSKKSKKIVKKNSRQVLPAVLVVVGCILLGLSILHQVLKLRALLPGDVSSTQLVQSETVKNPEQRPIIFTFGDTAVSVKSGIETSSGWTLDQKSVFHVEQSSYPNENGNIIIYGHNTKSVLGNLKQLQVNDTVSLQLKNGSVREYQIFDIVTVSPNENGYLFPTAQEQLTIYTCTGWLDKDRLIVRAVPKE